MDEEQFVKMMEEQIEISDQAKQTILQSTVHPGSDSKSSS